MKCEKGLVRIKGTENQSLAPMVQLGDSTGAMVVTPTGCLIMGTNPKRKQNDKRPKSRSRKNYDPEGSANE